MIKGDEDICFSDYAWLHIDWLIDNRLYGNARNDELALQHMEKLELLYLFKFSRS